jgi:hypothetical protein
MAKYDASSIHIEEKALGAIDLGRTFDTLASTTQLCRFQIILNATPLNALASARFVFRRR